MPRAQIRPRLIIGIIAICLISASLCGCQLPMFSKGTSEPEVAKNPCIVLALPASGPYSVIATKIRRGAEIGRQELLKNGIQARIENINTEAPDWLARLSGLPEECAVVGGPLQDKAYMQARQAGLLEQRAFFAFVPTLAQGDEGIHAWRFFPSPQDQVETLTRFITDDMNIRTYGALYPADNYGRKMSDMMEQTLKKRHIPLQKAAYTPGAPTAWPGTVAQLIQPRKAADGKTPVPQTMFEALFIPDSWKNMDQITNSLLVNGEDRLALLGTTLWEQGLAGKQVPKAEKYALAIFPGAWNQAKAPPALRGAGNDFWSALGYDFINFGANVALAMRPEAAYITSRAQKSAGGSRALAPLYYDEQGIAHQRMYLFQVTSSGMAPLNPDRFRQARTAAAERAALRMQGWSHIDPSTGEALPAESNVSEQAEQEPVISQPVSSPSAEPVAQPVMQEPAQPRPMPDATGGVMRDAPRPSYKLSLPVRK